MSSTIYIEEWQTGQTYFEVNHPRQMSVAQESRRAFGTSRLKEGSARVVVKSRSPWSMAKMYRGGKDRVGVAVRRLELRSSRVCHRGFSLFHHDVAKDIPNAEAGLYLRFMLPWNSFTDLILAESYESYPSTNNGLPDALSMIPVCLEQKPHIALLSTASAEVRRLLGLLDAASKHEEAEHVLSDASLSPPHPKS
jgi:hypothetical protein